jgi:hypothetical protein
MVQQVHKRIDQARLVQQLPRRNPRNSVKLAPAHDLRARLIRVVLSTDHRVATRVIAPEAQKCARSGGKRTEEQPAEVQRAAQAVGLLRRQPCQRVR